MLSYFSHDFFQKEENKIINKFLKNGYYIGKVEDKKSLDYINKCIKKNITKKKHLISTHSINIIKLKI